MKSVPSPVSPWLMPWSETMTEPPEVSISLIFAMVSAGIAIGIVAELLSTRAVAAQLYGVRPTDAVTVVAASVFLLVTAACAAFLPARRASRLNPVIALRHD